MADSIQSWIASYLIAIAEDHGANIASVPYHQKPKKVQLTEWLTYGNNNDDILWARISDKDHTIPIRFTTKAIAEYNRLNVHKRITQHKTAITFIKNFKPFFTRVPRGGNMKLTSQCVLAIDCDSVSLFGSFDEARFGSPKEVEANNDLRLWSEGLRQDGGGGNVLKQRKEAKQATAVLDTVPQTIMPPKKSITIPPPIPDNPPRKAKALALTSNGQSKPNHIDLLRKRERLFRRIKEQPRCASSSLDAAAIPMDGEVLQKHQNTNESLIVGGDPHDELRQEKTHGAKSPREQRRPSLQHVLNLDSHHQSQRTQSRESSPGIPVTNWSPSPPPASRKPGSSPPATSWSAPVTQNSFVPSSHPTAPTPAQRQKDTTEALPPSSPPPESEVVAHETVLLPPPATPLRSHDRYPVIRKVPRPPQPIPANQSDFGPTQILVPNSDTSLSYSQSQPLSQSQSHSLEEVHESSQPVVLSQLSALSKPRKDIDAVNSFVHKGKDPDADDVRDATAEESPLFSGTFDEDAPYEGDQSSLDHANEESPKQTHLNRVSSPPHPTYSQEEGLTDASIIAQPAVTQRRPEEIHTHSIDNDADVVKQGTAEAQHDTEPKNPEHDDMMVDVTQVLDEDDAQIHHELSGPSYVSQSRNFRQQHSPPGEYVRDPAGGIEAHVDTDHSKSPLKSPGVVITDNTRPTPEGDATLNEMPGTGIGVVQHDAAAWSAPSFLRASSSTNTRTGAPPHALGKSKAANTNSTVQHLKVSLSREASFPRNRPPRVDQNQDPGVSCVPQQPNIIAHAQKKTPLAPVMTSLQSRPNKRSKDVNSDKDSFTESSGPHPKKRRVERTVPMNDAKAGKMALVKSSRNSAKRHWGKLKGYTVILDELVLEKESKAQPLVSWCDVKDILLKTWQDRDEETQL